MTNSSADWLAAFYFVAICGLGVPVFLSEALWAAYASGGHTMIAPGTSALIALAVICFGMYLSLTQTSRILRRFHADYDAPKVARAATALFVVLGFPYFLWSIELFMQGMDFSTELTMMTPVGIAARALALALMTATFFAGVTAAAKQS